MKRPAFQFYPADWRKDVGLQSCGIVARGVWWEMLCLMHEGEPYGHLSVGGRSLDSATVASLIRVRSDVFLRALHELESHGVFSRTDDGTIYSRRMVKDERIRTMRAAAGHKGGNPVLLGLKDKQNDPDEPRLLNLVPNLVVGHLPTPAFAFASASSPSGLLGEVLPARPMQPPKAPGVDRRGARLPAGWTPPETWLDWAVKMTGWDRQRVMRVAVVFRDYWLAQPGQKAVKADWGATWRNWIRKELERA